MTAIALIDDHLIVRSGFAQLLGLEADFQVVAEFGSGREALAGLPGHGVQVCICDISMPDISGLELLSQLPKGMAIIMLSVHDSPALVEQALNAGATDDNVVAFMQVNMQQTAMVQKSSDDACFRFLFPGVKGGINSPKILPRDVTMRRMQVDAAMMRSAYCPDKHSVTDAEREQARQDIQPIVRQLTKRYGSDLQLMSEPHKAVGKEGLVCNQVQELWRNVLQLPPARAAGIIRLSVALE